MSQLDEVFARWASKVEKCKWFSRIGTGELDGYQRVANWDAAVGFTELEALEEAQAKSIGDLREEVVKKSREQGGLDLWREFSAEWKSIVPEAREGAREICDRTLAVHAKKHEIPPAVVDEFWENFFHTIVVEKMLGADRSHLHREMTELFLDGYFPCGYKGRFPKGKLIVF